MSNPNKISNNCNLAPYYPGAQTAKPNPSQNNFAPNSMPIKNPTNPPAMINPNQMFGGNMNFNANMGNMNAIGGALNMNMNTTAPGNSQMSNKMASLLNKQNGFYEPDAGPNYTNMQGNYDKNAGYRGRGSNRGGNQNFGRTFDKQGRANTGQYESRGGFSNNRGRGNRGRGTGSAMPISRGGHHRTMLRDEDWKNKDKEHLPNEEEDDLFRPKIHNKKQQEFMDRKREGTKSAAQNALAKVKARKMMWRSQRKIIEEKEEKDKQEQEQRQQDVKELVEQQRQQAEAEQEDQSSKKIPEEGNFSDPDEAENYHNAKESLQSEENTEDKEEKPTYERTNQFYVKRAMLNPFGGNMGEKFQYIPDEGLEERILNEEKLKKEKEEEEAKKMEENKKHTTKFGLRVAPQRPTFSSSSIITKGPRPKFSLSDPHVKKTDAIVTSQRLLMPNREKKFADSTYIGIQPFKLKEIREKEAAKLAEEKAANMDPREALVYKDKAAENEKNKNVVNTAIPQPKIISSTSDYYEQAVESLSGDKARQMKFQKLMGMGKKRKVDDSKKCDDDQKDGPAPLRRTYDPTSVNQTLESQFNTLRGGKNYFDN